MLNEKGHYPEFSWYSLFSITVKTLVQLRKVSNSPETRVTLSSAEKLDILRNKFVEKLDNSIKLHDTLYGFKEKTLAETRLLLKFNSQILSQSNFS